MSDKTMYSVGFGGGCHWCTEAVFQSISGVEQVLQGYIAASGDNKWFSEGVVVQFDPDKITLKDLITIHLMTHGSSSDHSRRSKYRSAVYAYTREQFCQAEEILQQLQQKTDGTLVTRVYIMKEFKPSPDRYFNYYFENPEKPFCKIYIKPKLNSVYKLFPEHVNKLKVL